jgi:four helix bundle protein
VWRLARELEETAYWLELLVDGKIAPKDKLSAVRQECDELIAIFVTILKSSKEGLLNFSFLILTF